MKRVGRALEFLALAAFFALAAAALALRFWLLPDIERYREPIVAAVSRAVGQPVKIGAIAAGWLGLNPRVRLRDVRVYDHAGREVLALPSIETRIAWRALLRAELKLRSLAIDDLRLQVRRSVDGELQVAGMKLAADPRLGGWALAQDEIVLRNARIEWHDELRGAPPLELSDVNLRLRSSGGEHFIGLTARVPEALGSTLELRANLEASRLAEPARWSGRLYAELGSTELAAWRPWLDYPWEIDEGRGALRAWLSMERGAVRRVTADLALTGVAARLRPELAPLRLSSVQGRLQGGFDGERYELVARGFAAGIEGVAAAAPSDFELRWQAGDKPGGTLVAAALELEPLARIAASLPLPEKAREVLAEMKPRGRLAEARLEWRGELPAPAFAARAKFIDLAAAPTAALPGFAGISGSFDADESSARVVFATRKGEIELPRVFPHPRIALDFLNGLVEWERRGDAGFALRLASAAFSNAAISGNAYGSYTSAPGGRGTIDLAAHLDRADFGEIDRYLPHARLMGGEAARGWLERGVLSGYSRDVRVRIRGDLNEFPFVDPARGEFSVSAHLERGILEYAPGWPRIENIEGELLFERDAMKVLGRSASVQGIALSNVTAAMARLAQPGRRLEVSGEADGATADFLKFVNASPVRHASGGLADGISASGRGRLRLELDIPLKEPRSARVAGEYDFAGNELVVHAMLPPLERAAGRLRFTESTLEVSGVEARLFGGPVAIAGATQRGGGARIVAKGEASVEATRAVLEHPWLAQLSGQAAYAATIDIAKDRTRVLLESPLQGVTSALPAPLAKSAQETLPLELELVPGERFRLGLGGVLAAERVGGRTGVSLSPAQGAPVRLPQADGILVYGTLAALDADQWRALLAGSGAAHGATTLELRIGTLDVYGKRLHDVGLRGEAQPSGWTATLEAQELAGDLAFRAEGGGSLVARLTRFRTPEAYPGAEAREAFEPRQLPSMDLVAERFSLRGNDLGRVEILGRRAGEDWRIEKLAMENAEASLGASGAWRSGTPTRSELDFELRASDAGLFLARIGYPGLVKEGRATLKGSLAWHGDPGTLDYPSLSGAVALEAARGQFLEIEPGLGKLVSLMSLQSLPRRIALDFRDVFSKGFGFERIAATGHIAAGVMSVKDFRMRGSSAQVEMSGEVDLANETQNMRVRVVPSLGDSAATVIALVNPLLAIPAAIAQKILKDPLGHIFAFDYAITGGWSDPKVVKLGVEAREAGPQEAVQ